MLASDTQLDQDVVFDILSSARRRYAISILNRRDEPMQLTELAEEIAALEMETSVDDLTKQQRKRVYVSLYQTHVPKMEEVGIVAYDADEGTVALADGVDAVDEFLTEPEETYPWHRYYLGVSLVAGGLLLLTVLDVAAFAALPDVLVAGATILAFLALAGIQYVTETRYSDSPPEIR
ncbi:DUF7344 domain-containing protein [Salinirussus salinus]|jgi:hypothetical protein|uniref:DUF7344 domain-containing protein n=1 Tax=Salinirussus salinus TaxID=1198300 RepID=UPI00135B26CB|nr:hypothetical protein [Salinirussus salinus]